MEKLLFAFPCAVNRVIHGGIASYAYFHNACPEYLKLFGWAYIIMLIEFKEGVNEDVGVYFCTRSSEKVGNCRKTGTKVV